MPSKGRKVALRQAGLKKKRDRGAKTTQVFQSAPVRSSRDESIETVEDTSSINTKVSLQDTGKEDSKHTSFLGTELRRVAVVTTCILIILAVLTVLLG